MEKSCEECLRYFNSGGEGGWNCAESTVYGLTTILNLASEDILPMATPFGGDWEETGTSAGAFSWECSYWGTASAVPTQTSPGHLPTRR